jgi:hypothetical protein
MKLFNAKIQPVDKNDPLNGLSLSEREQYWKEKTQRLTQKVQEVRRYAESRKK